ncbi:hypothetical protein [Mucilaginibacter flavidus]|uniref:hypothetical protein n=1 Tax=Mucilaginibacter flavidus TaxID=2949309 RepID=UPI002092FF13|nr:hypothetical protein [Mucilaginibacter flavidus]MCO5949153.1 hypothetical protein [Mucilaginibacter flavidus]
MTLTTLSFRQLKYGAGCLLFLLWAKPVSAQVVTKTDMVKLTAAADSFRNRSAVEKLYCQFDKPYYAVGDTIWFKAYLLNAAYLTPSVKSGIMYVELVNDSNKVVQRQMLPVANGLSWGNIGLDPKTVVEGGYTFRAYTNWMRNFGETYVFKQRIYIASPSANNWLVNTRFSLTREGGIEKGKLKLQFNQFNNQPAILKELDLNVLDGPKTWYKSKVQTKLDGTVDVDFTLKSPVKKLTLIAQETGIADDTHKLIIPVNISRPENIDLQFMPEGGALVAGLPAHVGFKAIGEDGKAVNVEGAVYDSHQQQIAQFKTVHKGMGAFDMMPAAGEVYIAKVTLQNGVVKTYSLPAVQNSGTTLKITQAVAADSLVVTIVGVQVNGSYYLIGQANGVVCFGAIVNLDGTPVKSKISTAGFPTGIARFTLLNAARQPLNERMIFINHNDFLRIDAKPDKPGYGARDSIGMQINITDKNGQPVQGSFSMAVTDDSQVKIDSVGTTSIISNLLLTSDLKGTVEEPGYYFRQDADGSIQQQLDNLLLTQGWVGYNWSNILATARQLVFKAEKEFIINGQVTNVFNKPVVNSHVLLFSKKPPLLMDSVTNKGGSFSFRNIIPLDTPYYMLQARNKRGKSFNIDLKVDEFKPPLFAMVSETATPWYVNSDTITMNYIKGSIANKTAKDNYQGSGHILKEVKITAKKFIKDSQNLNGPGNADVVIDEKELEKAGKKTFLDLLKERVEGFHEGAFLLMGSHKRAEHDNMLFNFVTDLNRGSDPIWYFIHDRAIKLIIDGVPLSKVYAITGFRDINDYLTTHSAEDVKGIEVNITSKYTMKYIPMDAPADLSMADVAFVEITTRAGSGPVMPYTPGTYLYKPMPFSLPKQFYQPKYTVKNKDTAAKDLRSTIAWYPNIITDKDGKASVSFHSSDRAGTYTLILEGTDINGNLGSYRRKIILSKR